MKFLERFDHWEALLFSSLLAAAGLIAWVAVEAIRADGRIDHCYVSYSSFRDEPGSWLVKGHVNWRDDVTLGEAKTSSDAALLLGEVCK